MISTTHIQNDSTDFTWYDICELTPEDTKILQKEYNLSNDLLAYASDKHERPHYDHRNQNVLIVFDIPQWPHESVQHFTSCPITFLMREKQIFTFHTKQAQYVIDKLKNDQTIFQVKHINEFLLHSLYKATISYTKALLEVNTKRNQIDSKLNQKISNQQILDLSEVEKSLIYIISGTQTNLMMLEKLPNSPFGQALSDEDLKIYDNIMIEAHQASRMAEISAEVTERITITSNNLLNNNLNDIIKILTYWSLLLTIPTIITGFYGMNVFLPFANVHNAWLVITGVSIILMLLLVWYLKANRKI